MYSVVNEEVRIYHKDHGAHGENILFVNYLSVISVYSVVNELER
jgi:hypothetical protein